MNFVLSEAVYNPILASGLFEGITAAGEDWILSMAVVEFGDPEWGLDITAQVAVRWELTGTSGEVYWTERIETEHTATPEDAFYVKCDEETNPPEVRDVGQVVVECGVAPVRPAEFVVFKVDSEIEQRGSGE